MVILLFILGRNYAKTGKSPENFDKFVSLLTRHNLENLKIIKCRYNKGNLQDFIKYYSYEAPYEEKLTYFQTILTTFQEQTVLKLN